MSPAVSSGKGEEGAMTVWRILSKVRVEAFCWGAGTALGELPPYFMARSGSGPGGRRGAENESHLRCRPIVTATVFTAGEAVRST